MRRCHAGLSRRPGQRPLQTAARPGPARGELGGVDGADDAASALAHDELLASAAPAPHPEGGSQHAKSSKTVALPDGGASGNQPIDVFVHFGKPHNPRSVGAHGHSPYL